MDHPRSRGVYAPDDGRAHVWAWIIPARAGFTTVRGATRPAVLDHPRSRGVYQAEATFVAGDDGSSPLARGLLNVRALNGATVGIIPARAGFTGPAGAARVIYEDHPRSRGVYLNEARNALRFVGSSPLARGLQGGNHNEREDRRIIPARAGFTPSGGTAWRPRSDHPRSRGVYCPIRGWRSGTPGSSPLARGLRGCGHRGRRAARIIPARAGFTWASAATTARCRDHPRSRGVYPCTRRRSTARPGSSPLARGLPASPHARGKRLGIIPARAGFTCRRPGSPRPAWDHPRSRGVYSVRSTMQGPSRGSSPLARGLLL